MTDQDGPHGNQERGSSGDRPSLSAEDVSAAEAVRLAVISNRIEAICRQMTNALQRAGRSAVLSMGRDFSVAIVTGDDRLLASAESLPIHVLGIELQAANVTKLHSDLRSGDAFLDNDPYGGNTHHADHTILVPVIIGHRHMFTVCAKAHQADAGNAVPTTYYPHARDVYEEGALNFPCVRIQRERRDVADIIRMCRRRIRVPDQWYGDYLATLGAARVGEELLTTLIADLGVEAIEAFAEGWFDYSERRMGQAIGKLPARRLLAAGRLDPFPGAPEGIQLQADIHVRADEGNVTVDLRGNPDAVRSGLNLSRATSISAASAGVLNALEGNLPCNAGAFRRIEVLLRENAVVGIPRHPTSCSVATTVVADRVINMIQAAMSDLGEGFGLAEGGLGMAPGGGVISGEDSRRGGARYVNQLMLGVTGGPGSAKTDGWVNYVLPVVNGLQYRDSVEIDEQKYPLHVYEQRLICDGGGPGFRRGAPGARVSFGPSDLQMTVAYANDGAVSPPAGVLGGGDGMGPTLHRVDASGAVEELESVGRVELQKGERLVATHCGGGGYGDPARREPERVAADIEEGWVSAEIARGVYKVVTRRCTDGVVEVDAAATAALRRPEE